jgi:hypothetical protein
MQASPILETMLQDACVDISTLLNDGSEPIQVQFDTVCLAASTCEPYSIISLLIAVHWLHPYAYWHSCRCRL